MFQEQTLSSEQQMLRQVIARIAKDHEHSYFLRTVRSGAFPQAFWNTLAENGVLIPEAPEEHGGSGLGLPDLTVFYYALGVEALASYHLMGHYLAGFVLSQFGAAEQKAAYLSGMGTGKRWGVAMLEDTAGKNPFSCQTMALEDGDDYVINGRKLYVPCAAEVDYLLVTVRLGDKTDGVPSGIGTFIVERTADGLAIHEREVNVRVAEQREVQAITGDIFYNIELRGLRVNRSALVGPADGTVETAMMARYMLMLAAVSLGWGDRVVAKAVDYANQRVLYAEPISAYQAVQHPMVRAKTDLEMAKLLVERAVDALAETQDLDSDLTFVSVAKHAATEAAFAAFDIAMQVHGGSAFDREVGIITLWPLALIARTIPMNSDFILDRFGDRLLMQRDPLAPQSRHAIV